jgi:hypothetical protein
VAEAFRRCYYDASGKQEIISWAMKLRRSNEIGVFCICFARRSADTFRVSGVTAQSDPSDKLPMYASLGSLDRESEENRRGLDSRRHF